MRKKGFTLIELLVVIAIIAMLMAILMPALSKVKKIAMRVVCGTNLKGLGTAQTVYANDYNDSYVVQGQGGAHTWDDFTAQWNIPTKDWKNTPAAISIGASFYLLVREADVSPKSFVCPASDQKEFDGVNPDNLDIVQLWDFGHKGTGRGPENTVSYSYHQPYAAGQANARSTGSKSRFAADGTRSAAFAVMADQNPFFEYPKLTRGGTLNEATHRDKVALLGGGNNNVENLSSWEIRIANAQPHDREGQNIVFADGHTAYEQRSDVGVKNDNVYTSWNSSAAVPLDRRQGRFMAADKMTNSVPVGTDDSVLVNDGVVVEVGS